MFSESPHPETHFDTESSVPPLMAHLSYNTDFRIGPECPVGGGLLRSQYLDANGVVLDVRIVGVIEDVINLGNDVKVIAPSDG